MAMCTFIWGDLSLEGRCGICVVAGPSREALGSRTEAKRIGIGSNWARLCQRALERGRTTIIGHRAGDWARCLSSAILSHAADLHSILGFCETCGETVVASSAVKALARFGRRVRTNGADRHGRHALLWARITSSAR